MIKSLVHYLFPQATTVDSFKLNMKDKNQLEMDMFRHRIMEE